MGEHLPLVVARTATEQVVANYSWGERLRTPFVKRLGRLNVIMTIDENGWLAGSMLPFGVNNRMACSGHAFDMLETNASQVIGQPDSAAPQIVSVFRLHA